MNYTKGEWKARRASPDHVDIVSDAVTVATVWEERDTTSAQLIAAAPAMYEALKGFVQQMKRADEIYNRGECDSMEFEDAVKALAKAEGKEG